MLVLAGCGASGAASMVRSTHSWGELRLTGPYLERVADAVTLMATHCDGPFSVVDHESETGFTEAPRPDQTRVQFVCPARVEARRYTRAQSRSADAEEETPRELVIPLTRPATPSVVPVATTTNAAVAPNSAPVATIESSPTTTDEVTPVDEATTPEAAPVSPALALPTPPATSTD